MDDPSQKYIQLGTRSRVYLAAWQHSSVKCQKNEPPEKSLTLVARTRTATRQEGKAISRQAEHNNTTTGSSWSRRMPRLSAGRDTPSACGSRSDNNKGSDTPTVCVCKEGRTRTDTGLALGRHHLICGHVGVSTAKRGGNKQEQQQRRQETKPYGSHWAGTG